MIAEQVTGSTSITNPARRRLCFSRRIHESLVQYGASSELPYPARRSPHAVDIFLGKVGQSGQIGQIHKWTLSSNRKQTAPGGPHPVWRRPSATHPWTPSPSQARQGNLPSFGHRKKPTRSATRFGQRDRIREEVDFHNHCISKTEGTILRRRRITVSARAPAPGSQHQFENSQP